MLNLGNDIIVSVGDKVVGSITSLDVKTGKSEHIPVRPSTYGSVSFELNNQAKMTPRMRRIFKNVRLKNTMYT